MDQSKLSNNLNTEKGIQVEIQMLNTKDVPITYQQPENLKENYICTGWTCEPQTIQVSGTKEILDTISEIEIPTSTISEIEIPTSEIDVSDATKKVEKTVDITQYLPEGIKLVDENANTILITVMIEKEGSRIIEFPVEGIQVNNLKDKYELTFESDETVMIEKEGSRIIEFPVEGIQVNNLKDKYELTFESDEVIELKFIGEQTTLDQLDITNAVSIDLQDCKSTGEYEVPVSIEVPDGVELEKQPTIKVKLTEKEDETDQKADKKSDSTQEKSEK